MSDRPASDQSGQLSLLLERGLEPRPVRFGNRALLSRSSDPPTSRLADEEFTRSGRRANQKRELLAWLRSQSRALTSAEIARDSGLDRHSVARRLPDLERDDLVVRCPVRQCMALGSLAITWRAR